jgi:hypothetical protein
MRISISFIEGWKTKGSTFGYVAQGRVGYDSQSLILTRLYPYKLCSGLIGSNVSVWRNRSGS